MFGRKSQSTPSPEFEEPQVKPEGKGRPTPTRKEAELARKLRAKPPRTRREKSAAVRKARADQSDKMRQALKTGDERYLPARDRGPAKRFIRDWIDSRFTIGEILIPVLIIAMIPGFVGTPQMATFGSMLTLVVLLMTIVNIFAIRFGVRRQLKQRFPDQEPWKGTTYYAVMRSMQLRFLRLPKPQVKIGQQLSDTYR